MTTIAEAKAQAKSSYWASVGAVIVRAVVRVLAWHERARERRRLLAFSNYALRDIGMSREDAALSQRPAPWILGESDQPLWRARVNWVQEGRPLSRA
jgi:uncharacterized protein YjiS (DUF1127 family)